MFHYGYYNGKFAPTEALSLPFFSRTHFFGDGIYEGCLCEGGRIFFLSEHIERFYTSAESLELRVAKSPRELCETLYVLYESSGVDSAFLYFSALRGGVCGRVHAYSDEDASLLAFVSKRRLMDINRELSAITAEETRHSLCMHKTLSLLPSTIAARRAADRGAYECIFLEAGVDKMQAHVHEGTHSNIHILRNKILISPPSGPHVLDGISRRQLIAAARGIGIEVKEIPFTYKEMLLSDEVILTCSSAVCQRVNEIDGLRIGGKDSATLYLLQNEVMRMRR